MSSPPEDDAPQASQVTRRHIVTDKKDGDRRTPFTLSGPITRWSLATRELSVLDRNVQLAPHVSPQGLELGLRIVVAGYHDPSTGEMVVTRLLVA